MEDTQVDEEPTASPRRTGRRSVREKKQEKKSNKGLFIGIGVFVAVLVIVLVIVLVTKGGDKPEGAAAAPETAATETAKEPAKPKTPAKPKERLPPTGVYSTDEFKFHVLKLINSGKFDSAKLYIKSRKKDAPNEDLTALEKRLTKAIERAN